MPNDETQLYAVEPEMKMIAGNTLDLPYYANRPDKTPLDIRLTGTVIRWLLAPYETPSCAVLTKSNQNNAITIDAENLFTVHLAADDTANLCGLFLYQVEITDPNGIKTRPVEGTILIRQCIEEEL